MKIQGTRSEQVVIEVNENTFFNYLYKEKVDVNRLFYCLKSQFFMLLRLERGSYLKDGSWCYDYERYGGGHSWTKTEVQRSATKEEITVYNSLLTFKENLKVLLGGQDDKE